MKKGNGKKSFEEVVLERFSEQDRRFDAMQQQLAELTAKLIERIDQVNTRLDQVILNTGGHWRDLDRRVTAIEDRLGPDD